MVRFRYKSQVRAASQAGTLSDAACWLVSRLSGLGLSAPWFLWVGLLFPALCREVLKQFQVFTEVEEYL